LAALQEQITTEGVKAIFVGTTTNPQLAEQLASDLGIQVVSIYTDSLSDADGPAATYVDFMRYNMQTIVDALR
jgi:ABC-type Zn uptake system ZnuABC Zn-binding protein ZnuA